MSYRTLPLACIISALMAFPALAESQIEVHDPYAISATAIATSGAAFMVIHNHGDTADRLLSVTSPAAKLAQLHAHSIDANGVARMGEATEGWDIPAGGELVLERGDKHVMFMGLTAPFEDQAKITVTLVFESAGEIDVEVPIDLSQIGAATLSTHDAMTHTETEAPSE